MSDARAVRPLRLAFVKPDVGVTGGLELVVDRLEAAARASGWEVARVVVDAVPPRAEVAGLDIPRAVWEAAPEYFRYLWARDRFDRLDLRRHDVVVSTQPPSFAIDHPRHVSLFYHHHRVYYDLEEPFLAAGLATGSPATGPAIRCRGRRLPRAGDRRRRMRRSSATPDSRWR